MKRKENQFAYVDVTFNYDMNNSPKQSATVNGIFIFTFQIKK